MLMQFFRNGGFGMYPVLVLGLVTLGTAGYFAARADGKVRGFLDQIARSLLWAGICATIIDFMAVFSFLGIEGGSITDPFQFARIMAQGAHEALSPIAMAGAFLMLTYLLIAIGQRRVDMRIA